MPNPISKLLSLGDGRRLRQYRRTVDKINALEDGLSASAPPPARPTRAFCPSRSRSCARRRGARWGFATTTCSSSEAWP